MNNMLEKAITDEGKEISDNVIMESIQGKIILTEAGAKALLGDMTGPESDLVLFKDELPNLTLSDYLPLLW